MKKSKKYLIFGILIGVIYTGISVVTPRVSGELINSLIDSKNFIAILVAFLGLNLIQLLFSVIDFDMTRKYSNYKQEELRQIVIERWMENGTNNDKSIASVSTMVNQHIPSLVSNYFVAVIDISKIGVMLVLAVISLLSINGILAIVIFAISFLIVLIPKKMSEKSYNFQDKYNKCLENFNFNFNSFVRGIDTVRAYLFTNGALKIINEKNRNITLSKNALIKNQEKIYAATAILQTLKTLSIYVLGAIMVWRNEINVGELVAAVTTAEFLASPMEYLSMLMQQRNEAKSTLDSLKVLLNEKNGKCGIEKCDEIKSIRIEQLSAYAGENNKIFDEIDYELNANDKLLLLGPSGSGKSSLLSLLARNELFEHTGKIFVNGLELDSYSRETYNKRVAPVFQNTCIFEMSFKDNILLGRNCDDQRYNSIIEKLNLKYLDKRYKDNISEIDIQNLSGGEKARIGLARALVSEADLYLIDEITSSLDIDNSYDVEDLILNLKGIVINVAHKYNKELLNKYTKVIYNFPKV